MKPNESALYTEKAIIFGDIVKAAIESALNNGVGEREIFDQLEWAQVTAFENYYAKVRQENEGH